MGFSANLYIGPVVKLKKTLRVTQESFVSCSNDECPESKKHGRSKFCGTCGSPYVERTRQVERLVEWHDFVNDDEGKYEKWQDEFFSPEFDKTRALIPNSSRKDGSFAYRNGVEEDFSITIGAKFPENMKSQLEVFKANNAEVLQDMRDFGLDFEIDYVIQLYYS